MSSNFFYTLRVAKYIVGQKTKMLRFIFTIFSILLFFHLSLQCNTSGNLCQRFLRKFGTNTGYDLLYCVKENKHAVAYHSLYLSIFLSLR